MRDINTTVSGHGDQMSNWPRNTLVNPPDDSTIRQEKKKDYWKLLWGLNPNTLRCGHCDETGKERESLSQKERAGKGREKKLRL